MPWYRMSCFGSKACRQKGHNGPGAGLAGMGLFTAGGEYLIFGVR